MSETQPGHLPEAPALLQQAPRLWGPGSWMLEEATPLCTFNSVLLHDELLETQREPSPVSNPSTFCRPALPAVSGSLVQGLVL